MEEEHLDSRGRLLYVINLSGLTGKEFASKVNVSPSTISQITSTSEKSRKTGLSEMVVNKILSAFPQFNLSYEWLLNGIGPKTIQAKQGSLFDQPVNGSGFYGRFTNHSEKRPDEPVVDDLANLVKVDRVSEEPSDKGSANARTADVPQTSPQSKIEERQNDENANDAHSYGKEAATESLPDSANGSHLAPQKGATIERIVIFYSDGTFADYSPRVNRKFVN